VYLGEAGLLASLPRGAIAIDMTTSEPRLARELAAAGAERDVAVLDAPVSGGDVGARDGTLSIMVGGPDEAFQAVRPVLEVLGKRIVHQGPSGAGQHTKMANQIAIASTMIGAMEALRYAEAAGLDPSRVLESIGAGAAGSWTLSNLYPRVVAGDFAPGFYVRHFMKDLDIAADEATDMTLDLQGLDLARRMYRALMDAGHGDEGTQALYKALVE
jgi:3-hydroxyisobutyrate dehydrogenase